MTAFMPTPKQQYFGIASIPLIGGKIFTYAAGGSVPKATFTDAAGTIAQPNPIVLNARGEPPNAIFWNGSYRVVIQDALGNLIYSVDNYQTPVMPGDLSATGGAGLLGFDYAGVYAAGTIGKWLQNLAGAAGATFVSWSRGLVGSLTKSIAVWLGWQPVSPFEFMTPAQITDVQTGAFTLDVTNAVQAAIDSGRTVYLPAGLYKITRPLLLSKASQKIYGDGMNASVLSADSVFASATVGGDTGYAVMWYQAPGLASADDWIEGGEWSDFGINCNSVRGVREIDGIRVNRVCINQSFRNLKISNASNGINGTRLGFITKFDNVYIANAIHTGIRLNYAYNGCTFNNCFIFGATTSPNNADGSWTEVLLDIKNNCYGNIFTGGAIEGGRVAVRLANQAQISINGTDFEEVTETFIEISGNYVTPPYAGGLNAANPTSSAYGCNFVGVPSNGGIVVHGGSISVDGCFAVNNDAAPGPGVYFLNGIEGGDATITGFERLCISESNNTARGWANQYATGIVASRMTRVSTGGVTFPSPAIASADPSTLDDYREGSFVPIDSSGAALVFPNAAGEFTKIGNMVFGNAEITFPVTANGATAQIGGLPFAVGGAAGTFAPNRGGAQVSWTDSTLNLGSLLVIGGTTVLLFSNAGVGITNSQMSGKSVWINFAYHV